MMLILISFYLYITKITKMYNHLGNYFYSFLFTSVSFFTFLNLSLGELDIHSDGSPN